MASRWRSWRRGQSVRDKWRIMAAVFRRLRLLLFFIFVIPLCAVRPAPRALRAGWRFLPDPQEQYSASALPTRGWRPVRVELSIQAQFADLRNFRGAAWYRRPLTLAPLPPGGHWVLRVGACDYRCAVYLNGRRLATHDGGYTPFTVELDADGRSSRARRNRLLIRIADPPGPPADWKSSYAQIPHGKQNWYVQTSGLWQSVRLAAEPAYYLALAHVLTRGREVRGIRVRIAHSSQIPPGARAAVAIFSPAGRVLLRAEIPLPARPLVTLPLALRGQWWSPRHPRLYRFLVSLPDGARIAGHFGLRTIAAKGGRLYLNGRPFYIRGALDQAFYPSGIYSPPSLDYLEREMRQARALGLNLLRLHIKIPDPRYLEAADRAGMLVWYEIPNWDTLTPLSEQRAQAALRAAIARDWNHPSLILQSIINESWGANLQAAWQRQWLRGMYLWAKARLPGRLVDDNSACCSNFHIQTDLADFHNYDSIPDHAAAWDQFVRAFAGRPKWLDSPYGDARVNPGAPLVLSEFGNWGLPQLPRRKPWWFSRGFAGHPITVPGGVERRLRHSALGAVFPLYTALARATERHQWQALRYEIESLRLQPGIQGYVITELTDVNWESNGLLTMWRRPKIFAPHLAALQRPVVVLAELSRPDYAAASNASLRLYVSNESSRAFTGGQVHIAGHIFPVPPLASGGVRPIGVVRLRLSPPPGARLDHPWAGIQTVHFSLTRNARAVDARSLGVPFLGGQQGGGAIRLGPASGPGWRTFAQRLGASGYRVLAASGAPAPGTIVLTPVWPLPSGAAGAHRVLVLADSPGALPTAGPERIVPRQGDLSGDWISNFNWVNTRRPPFRFLRGFSPILGRESFFITPRFLLTDPPRARARAELAGFFLGWVHASHALAVQARRGPTSVFVTTFRLARAYGRDPMATAMLNAIIKYMRSPAFQPAWRW